MKATDPFIEIERHATRLVREYRLLLLTLLLKQRPA